MASLTIRKLEETTKQRLRVRASRNGRSMEEEARQILKAAVNEKAETGLHLAESISKTFCATLVAQFTGYSSRSNASAADF